ncbi:ATP-grasp domain-containing protein [Chitinophaga sp. NPDC101104]|uniref:ATP-grasp domain-containing protein n=1 Tax=Chitinophaga sp. NPDC101104 TaxID=3390561 RepID=UPI003CFDAF04
MKKIGILYGQENTFPQAFIDRVNRICGPDVLAESVMIDKAVQGGVAEYTVVVDRISHDVPFYRAWLKDAALRGTAVLNNPFWWSADEKYFNNALALSLDIPVPNTALLPAFVQPDNTSARSFRNLAFPLDWEGIFKYVGFPAYMKPYAGGGWRDVHYIRTREEFFDVHQQTGQETMMLQAEVKWEEYYRCFCIGAKHVHIMPYHPGLPHAERYNANFRPSPALAALIKEFTISLNRMLGYDFNTVEFAVQDGVPYAIDFCNPAPDADPQSVGPKNFEWFLEHSAQYALERAMAAREDEMNLRWGIFVTGAAARNPE